MKLNLGSGQRRFGKGWTNLDIVSRLGQVPDVICDGALLPFANETVSCVVCHQTLEHFGCGEGNAMLREAWRVLAPRGSLLIFVPNLKALAQRWLAGEISDFIYIVNLMGAYQGLESDRHRWHYTRASLTATLNECGTWRRVSEFDWREIPQADLAHDFWVLSMEAVK